MVTKDQNRLIRVFFFSSLIIAITVLTTLIIALGGSGFDTREIIDIFNIYGTFFIAAILIILMMFGIETIIKKGDARYGNSLLFNSPGEFPAFSGFKRFNSYLLFLLSAFVFSIIGLFTSLQGQTFTGEVLIGQQFTPVKELLFRLFLIPLAENLVPAALTALAIVILRNYSRRRNISKAGFRTSVIFTAIIIYAGTGVINHLSRYGASDLNVFIVLGFWAIGGLLTAMSGSIIPFAVMHGANNLFFDLQSFVSSDTTLVIAFALIIGIGILGFIEFRRTRRKN